MAKYKALVGIDYPPNKRAEAGDIIDDLDGKSIKWLTEIGAIEAVGKSAPAPEPTPEPEFDPNAKDGDGDGIVQEGTQFERSVESEEA